MKIWDKFEKKSEFFIRIFVIFDYGGTSGSKKFRFSLAMLFQESKNGTEYQKTHWYRPNPSSHVPSCIIGTL